MADRLYEYWNCKTGKKVLHTSKIAAILLRRKEIEPIKRHFSMGK